MPWRSRSAAPRRRFCDEPCCSQTFSDRSQLRRRWPLIPIQPQGLQKPMRSFWKSKETTMQALYNYEVQCLIKWRYFDPIFRHKISLIFIDFHTGGLRSGNSVEKAALSPDRSGAQQWAALMPTCRAQLDLNTMLAISISISALQNTNTHLQGPARLEYSTGYNQYL